MCILYSMLLLDCSKQSRMLVGVRFVREEVDGGGLVVRVDYRLRDGRAQPVRLRQRHGAQAEMRRPVVNARCVDLTGGHGQVEVAGGGRAGHARQAQVRTAAAAVAQQEATRRVTQAAQAVSVVVAHAGVDERIDSRVRVCDQVDEPLGVRPPPRIGVRVLHVEQHELERRPAHHEQHQYPHEHHNHLQSIEKSRRNNQFYFVSKCLN